VVRFHGEQSAITVPPGQSIELPLKVQPQTRPFIGKTETHPFQVQVQTKSGETQQKQGVLEVRPRLPAWLMAVIPILIIMCCVGGIVGAQAWYNYDQGLQQTEAAIAALTAQAQERPAPDLAATQAAIDQHNTQATALAQAAANEATSTALAFIQQTVDAQQQAQETVQAEQTAAAQLAATPTGTPTHTPTPTPQEIVSCPFDGGGDQISRGFYVESYPGITLDTVEVAYTTNNPGIYTMAMVIRRDAYNGPIVGEQEISINISGASTEAIFEFDNVSVPQGTTLTFAQSIIAGPGSVVFYDTGPCGFGDCSDCPGIYQTSSTEPPLSTIRRESVGVTIMGNAP
jgi:hypothetical protein